MGQSYKCAICDDELNSPAIIGEAYQFCEECMENRRGEIDKYKKGNYKVKETKLRKIKENNRLT